MDEGIRLHKVIMDDSLRMGAVKIDTGEWVNCGFQGKWMDVFPMKGKNVLVIEQGSVLYWVGICPESN